MRKLEINPGFRTLEEVSEVLEKNNNNLKENIMKRN
jgi:hypothetical protein